MSANASLRTVADLQWGYFTSHQALAAGYRNPLQNYHVKQGNWLKTDWAIYRLKGYPDTIESLFTRWSLWAQGKKPDRCVVISHESALHYYGLGALLPQQIHLTVGSARRSAIPPGCSLHIAELAPDQYRFLQGFRITTPRRTLEDLRPDLTLRGVWSSTVQAAQREGLLDAGEVQALTGGGQGMAGERFFRGMATGFDPVRAGGAAMDSTGTSRRNAGQWRVPARSFTLVEMLVVIAIISILAALLLPAMNSAMASSRLAACSNNQRQVGMSINTYADGNQDYIPAVVTDTSSYSDYWDYTRIWRVAYDTAWSKALFRSSIFACPEYLAINGNADVSYALNGWFPTGSFGALTPHKRSLALSPSRCLLFGEGTNHHINGWYYVVPPGQPALFNHQGKMALTFMDGHTSSMYEGEVPTATTSIFWKGR